MRSIGLILAFFGLLLCGALSAAAAEKPGEAFRVVISQELKVMIDAQEPGLVVIDTRSTEEYQEAHIKGALSIPWARMENDRSLLNFPKESKLLFYCNGLT